MKSYRQIINEERPIIDSVTGSLDEIIKEIKTECSNFIKDTRDTNTSKPLYRGQRDELPSQISIITSPPFREPRDTNPLIHKIYDDYFTLSGFKAKRSNSIFATGSYEQASAYGKVYYIIPVNGYSFTWSPKVDDMLSGLSRSFFKDHYKQLFPNVEKMRSEILKYKTKYSDVPNIRTEDNIDRWLEWRQKYTSLELDKRSFFNYFINSTFDKVVHDNIRKEHEEIEPGTYYREYGIFKNKPVKDIEMPEVYEILKKYPPEVLFQAYKKNVPLFKKYFDYKNTDIESAIRSRNEIHINGTCYIFKENEILIQIYK